MSRYKIIHSNISRHDRISLYISDDIDDKTLGWINTRVNRNKEILNAIKMYADSESRERDNSNSSDLIQLIKQALTGNNRIEIAQPKLQVMENRISTENNELIETEIKNSINVENELEMIELINKAEIENCFIKNNSEKKDNQKKDINLNVGYRTSKIRNIGLNDLDNELEEGILITKLKKGT